MKNKKKLWARLGLISMAAVMVTTAVIGITYAKYVKTVTKTNETGTVAKIGVVTATWSENGLFLDQYVNGVSATTVMKTDTLAPGTTNESTLSIEQTQISEVSANVLVDLGGLLTGWTLADNNAYEPVTFNVYNGEKYCGTDGVFDDESAVEMTMAQIIGLPVLTVGTIDAGDATTEFGTKTIHVTWTWAFENNEAANDFYLCKTADGTYAVGDVITKATYDAGIDAEPATINADNWEVSTNSDFADTYLQDKGVLPTIAFTSSVSISQID